MQPCVAHEEGREAPAARGCERLLRTDADGAEVERPERRREHAVAKQLVEHEVAANAATRPGSTSASATIRSNFSASWRSRQIGW
nr:hypothetical protein [Agromyces marinus]